MRAREKYRCMIGTTSRVPGAPGWHYLILDIDGKISYDTWNFFRGKEARVQRTQSGWHVYINVKMHLKQMLRTAVKLGADPKWTRIARKRGYAFLADKAPVKLPWPVERMTVTTK